MRIPAVDVEHHAGDKRRAREVRKFEVRAIELFTARRRDAPIGPVSQALWTRLAERPEPSA
jgi:hypothetical protein